VREMLLRWFEEGRRRGKTYLAVVQDTGDIPEGETGFHRFFVDGGESLEEAVAARREEGAVAVRDIFDLGISFEVHLAKESVCTPEAFREWRSRYIEENPGALEDLALQVASRHHAGQQDKSGSPYVFHPVRVSAGMETPHERAAALLHDVVEDTPLTLDDLRERGFPERVVEAVGVLTKREGEDYFEFVARCLENPIARRVKIGDLTDNMDVTRLKAVDEKARRRLAKYDLALEMLR